jgi:hypothetical protein
MTDSMTTTHGRADRRGLPWFATALAASGLILAVADARPANACHIKHEDTSHESKGATTPSTTSSSSAPTMTPDEMVQQSFQKLLHDLPVQTQPQSQPMIPVPTSTTSSSTTSTPVALPQILVPTPASSTPAVSNWHQSTPNNLMPPTPPSTCDNSPTTGSASSMTPPSMQVPAPLLVPMAAPEPSTFLIAGVLAGAFAWRSRRKSK